MTDALLPTILVAFFASLGPTLVGLAGLWTAIRNERKSDVIIDKATEIHTLTNSTLSKVQADLAVANAHIDGLQAQIAQLVQAKAVADTVASSAAFTVAERERVAREQQQQQNNPDESQRTP